MSYEDPTPVYALSEFGEEAVLYFPEETDAGAVITRSAGGGSTRRLMQLFANNAAVNKNMVEDVDYEFLIDMPAWLFKISAKILDTPGAGGVSDFTLTVVRVAAGLPNKTLYSQSMEVLGAPALQAVYFPEMQLSELLPQFSLLLFRVSHTGANHQALAVGLSQSSYIELHLHPAKDHGRLVLSTEKSS